MLYREDELYPGTQTRKNTKKDGEKGKKISRITSIAGGRGEEEERMRTKYH